MSDSTPAFTMNKAIVSQNGIKKNQYTGFYAYLGVLIRFSVTDQLPVSSGAPIKAMAYRYRGTISLLDPTGGGEVLQYTGAEAKAIVKKYCEKHPEKGELSEEETARLLRITVEVKCNAADESVLSENIRSKCQKMLAEHQNLIARRISLEVSPATLTPVQAALLYTESYLDRRHSKASEKARTSIRNAIMTNLSKLEAKPMARFTKRDIQKFIKAENISVTAAEQLRLFWAYCLERRRCDGSNPFVSAPKKKPSPESQIKKSTRRTYMSPSERDWVYRRLMEQPTVYAAIFALALWCGLPLDTVLKLTWDKISFKYGMGILTLSDTDLGDEFECATHNLTFAMAPQAKEILTAYKNALQKKGMVLSDRRIAESDPPVTQTDIKHFIDAVLSRLAAAEVEKASPVPLTGGYEMLVATYQMMIEHECGIREDEGTKRFLQHRPLSTLVTDDHYVSYTDMEALRRQHTILRRTAPTVRHRSTVKTQDPSTTEYLPDSSRECIQLDEEITLLPGESIRLRAEHGLSCSYRILKQEDEPLAGA